MFAILTTPVTVVSPSFAVPFPRPPSSSSSSSTKACPSFAFHPPPATTMSDPLPIHDLSPPSSEEGVPPQPASPTPSPHSPSSGGVESPLIPPHPPLRSMSSGYISSPLNPNFNPRSRPVSRGSAYLSRLASEESSAFAGSGQRGSMLLYRLASEDDQFLSAPAKRFSIGSESVFSFDSKYPTGSAPRGMIPYVYDPESEDKNLDPDDELHRIDDPSFAWSWRGIANFSVLIVLITALLALFVLYPVFTFVRDNKKNLAIDNNIHINATGQSPVLFQMPELIDPDTPDSAKTRQGFDGFKYNLVFSDEFNSDGRTFFPGDDPFWEAVDLWYGATGDLEWYLPQQIFTRDGSLVILIEDIETNNLQYRSGMLQSWNKFCFTSGYIEVNLSLPGPNVDASGYVSNFVTFFYLSDEIGSLLE